MEEFKDESVKNGRQPFRLPQRNKDNNEIIRYLTQQRKLSINTINRFIKDGTLYEDAEHHNAVFVGRDIDNVPLAAEILDTETNLRSVLPGSLTFIGFVRQGVSDSLLVFETPVDLMSYMDLFPEKVEPYNLLSFIGDDSETVDQYIDDHPQTKKVYLCLNSTETEKEVCGLILKAIPKEIGVTRIFPGRSDWNDFLIHRNEMSNEEPVFEVLSYRKAEKPVSMIKMSEVVQEEVEWLWYPYIPFGKLTLIQGNPGEGKTFFATQLIGACTNHHEIPGLSISEPFNVIYQNSEDGLGDTIKPRLIEAGANLERVLVIDDRDKPLTLTDDRILKAIMQNNARLMIVDPLQSFLGAEVDMNRANEIRPLMRMLGEIAQQTKCAIIMIGHLNKASGAQSTYRSLGSIDIVAAVRSLLFIGKVRNNPTVHVIIQDKNSLAPIGSPIAFSLEEENGFEWIGEYDITIDELLSGSEGAVKVSKKEQAVELVEQMLADWKHVSLTEINAAAKTKGISERTMREAKSMLGDRLKSERIGNQWYHWLE